MSKCIFVKSMLWLRNNKYFCLKEMTVVFRHLWLIMDLYQKRNCAYFPLSLATASLISPNGILMIQQTSVKISFTVVAVETRTNFQQKQNASVFAYLDEVIILNAVLSSLSFVLCTVHKLKSALWSSYQHHRKGVVMIRHRTLKVVLVINSFAMVGWKLNLKLMRSH